MLLRRDDLAFFRRARTWGEILCVSPYRDEAWWREALIEADEHGLGLLAWDKRTRRWMITERGERVIEEADRANAVLGGASP